MSSSHDRYMISTAVALTQMEDDGLRRLERLREIDEAVDDTYLREEVDFDSLGYDRFLTEPGSDGILVMTNLSHADFETLFTLPESAIVAYWSVGGGRRYEVAPRDALFMALNVLKRYSHWDMPTKVFGLKTSSFENMVLKVLMLIEAPLREQFIKPLSITRQRQRGQMFRNYPYALYATDVKSQEAYKPSGRFIEVKRYYSGKHHLYGLKLEMCVALPGMCVSLSKHHPGAVHDKSIMMERRDFHERMLKKNATSGELVIEDNGEGHQDFSGS